MLKKIQGLIFVLVCLNWVSAVNGFQTDSNVAEEMLVVEKGAYGIPLGVKLDEFLKWCDGNHVKVMNDSFSGKKKAIENDVKEMLINNLDLAKDLQRQAREIMNLKLDGLKGLLIKIRDEKSISFDLGQFNTEEPLAEIEYIQGPLYLFRYGNEDLILQNFFKNKDEIKNIILDKLQYPRGRNHGREEVNEDIFRESMINSADVLEKIFASRYRLLIDLQDREANENGLGQVEVLFFRSQNNELENYAVVYYYSSEYADILIKSLTTKYGRPTINNSRNSIFEISRVENIYLDSCYSNKDFDINVELYSTYATRGWKDNIFIYHVDDYSPERLVYHEKVLWPQIWEEFEKNVDNAVGNYERLIKSHGDKIQNRL